MKTQSLILLAGAVTLAAGTAFVARALMRPPPPVTIVKEVKVSEPAPEVALALFSKRALAPGEFIDGAALAWRELPAESLRAAHFSATTPAARQELERKLYGATLRRPVAEGEPLAADLLIHAGEPGFLPAVLRPGMRAVSIPTGMVPSNAGLVAAGDWVDVILSLDRQSAASTSESAASTGGFSALGAQTILRHVRVLALNRDTASLAPAAAAAESKDDPAARRRQAANYESITLEVQPKAAEVLAVAREVGTLQVALRSVQADAADAAEPQPATVTRLKDATTILRYSAPSLVRTYHGGKQGLQTFGSGQ